jgi:hypothetical protein
MQVLGGGCSGGGACVRAQREGSEAEVQLRRVYVRAGDGGCMWPRARTGGGVQSGH